MKNILVALIIIIFGLTSCKNSNNKLVINNRTSKKILFLHSVMDTNQCISDVFDCSKYNPVPIIGNYELKVRDYINYDSKLKTNPNKILRVYFFNGDTLNKYGTCETIKRKLFMKQYDLKFDDLVKSNWEIIYDGK